MENFITCKYISLVMLFEKVKMSVEVEMFTLIIFHKIKENIRSDNKEWIQAHTTADKTLYARDRFKFCVNV